MSIGVYAALVLRSMFRGVAKAGTSIVVLVAALGVVGLVTPATRTAVSAGAPHSPRVTSRGRLGPLRMDRSGPAAIMKFAGRPDVTGWGQSFETAPEWEALGYRCRSRNTAQTYVAPSGVDGEKAFCRTVFHVNISTGRLATFFTSLPRYRDGHGIRVGMHTGRARHLARQPAYSGCGDAFRFVGHAGALVLPIAAARSKTRHGKLVAVGGHVAALVLHSARHDVGVFDCW